MPKREMMILICIYLKRLQMMGIEVQLRDEKLKAKEEGEDLAQEMAELRYDWNLRLKENEGKVLLMFVVFQMLEVPFMRTW
ncbi:hypothetical protein L2E82_09100 [Cichorium intybus]|uniref:Uncharacterized protein n=1 Tax=Cichorium intybus TaxID=13427 RepID=A0ACB9G797_CICIN|nr:hypothetical protein L2E82_09100 [Cichorium intybus]